MSNFHFYRPTLLWRFVILSPSINAMTYLLTYLLAYLPKEAGNNDLFAQNQHFHELRAFYVLMSDCHMFHFCHFYLKRWVHNV